MQSLYISPAEASFVDLGESFQLADIKKEIKEEEIAGDDYHLSYYSRNDVKQEIKEENKETNEEQSVQDSNIETDDHLVDCSQYVQIEMNLT